MKKITADFLRQEIARLGSVVVETAIYHASGQKLHGTGEVLSLAHAKMLRESFLTDLHLAEFDEDIALARKSLGVQRILPAQAVEGDILVEDIRNLRQELVVPAGRPLTAEDLARVRVANVLMVTIQHRGLAALSQEVDRYRSQQPEPLRGLRETGTRTRTIQGGGTSVRYPLIPRAKVLVVVSDDLLRAFLVSALLSTGHDVQEHASLAKISQLVQEERPEVVLLDLEESREAIPKIREESPAQGAALIVCCPEGKAALAQQALIAGANDLLPRPPSRDALQEKIQGCQGLLGRKVLLPPSLRSERRRGPRQSEKMACSLQDAASPKPLPVSRAEIIDRSPAGLRMDYNLPVWPQRWAYSPHGVHPRHFFYAYAAANPMGRDLTLLLPGPHATSVELQGRVVHVSPGGTTVEELEVVGITLSGSPAPDPAPSRATGRRSF